MLLLQRLKAGGAIVSSVVAIALLAGCASPQPKAMVNKRPQTKEYFPESKYGVKASPRVSDKRSRLPRGGGRDQIGRPYQIAGKWYHPKEQPNYSKKGRASWYGDAFHGRLTANGEIYDMTHLTAAHPTLPLPSYARVTNLKNGSSVVVRINDRGPYAHGRIIDLSKRAAEMLDYTHSGIADVKVDYVGRAPLHGQDDEFLLASYRPGGAGPSPSDGLPTGVMIAMAGPTPTGSVGGVALGAFPAQAGVVAQPASVPAPFLGEAGPGIELPEFGPVIADRPLIARSRGDRLPVMSYADRRISAAAAVLDRLGETEAGTPRATVSDDYVAVGTFTRDEAARQAIRLAAIGRVEVDEVREGATTWHAVRLLPDGRTDIDGLLRQAWASGATEAFVVRG